MNIFKRINRYFFKADNIVIESLKIRYSVYTEFLIEMETIEKEIKLDKPLFGDKDSWTPFYELHKEHEKKHGSEYDKEAFRILKELRKDNYRKINNGHIVTGKHLVKCTWEIYNGKTRKPTNDDWERYIKHKNGKSIQ